MRVRRKRPRRSVVGGVQCPTWIALGRILAGFGLLWIGTGIAAHPGKTASDGCHYCRSNCDRWGEVAGLRHCHHGVSTAAPKVPRERPATSGTAVDPLEVSRLLEEPEPLPPPPSAVRLLRVFDGDTFLLSLDGEALVVDLDAVDAPEASQPGGRAALDFARSRLAGRPLRIEILAAPRGRPLRVRLGPEGAGDFARELVAAGHAWVDHDAPPTLSSLQAEARGARRGLWSDPAAIPPSIWRRRQEMN